MIRIRKRWSLQRVHCASLSPRFIAGSTYVFIVLIIHAFTSNSRDLNVMDTVPDHIGISLGFFVDFSTCSLLNPIHIWTVPVPWAMVDVYKYLAMFSLFYFFQAPFNQTSSSWLCSLSFTLPGTILSTIKQLALLSHFHSPGHHLIKNQVAGSALSFLLFQAPFY